MGRALLLSRVTNFLSTIWAGVKEARASATRASSWGDGGGPGGAASSEDSVRSDVASPAGGVRATPSEFICRRDDNRFGCEITVRSSLGTSNLLAQRANSVPRHRWRDNSPPETQACLLMNYGLVPNVARCAATFSQLGRDAQESSRIRTPGGRPGRVRQKGCPRSRRSRGAPVRGGRREGYGRRR